MTPIIRSKKLKIVCLQVFLLGFLWIYFQNEAALTEVVIHLIYCDSMSTGFPGRTLSVGKTGREACMDVWESRTSASKFWMQNADWWIFLYCDVMVLSSVLVQTFQPPSEHYNLWSGSTFVSLGSCLFILFQRQRTKQLFGCSFNKKCFQKPFTDHHSVCQWASVVLFYSRTLCLHIKLRCFLFEI